MHTLEEPTLEELICFRRALVLDLAAFLEPEAKRSPFTYTSERKRLRYRIMKLNEEIAALTEKEDRNDERQLQDRDLFGCPTVCRADRAPI
jgi:hypothetical protein